MKVRPYPLSDRERLRHPLEGPPTTLKQRFYPYGFPVDISTNSTTVLEILDSMWRPFSLRFHKDPVHCEIVVAETSETHCPPAPRHHLQLPLLTTICDGDNFSIVDLDQSTVYTHITEGALQYPFFAGYFLLSTPYSCICTRDVTPIHGACVSWNSRSILLCGDSGAGKSTLAYACARRGWVYTSDDASYLLNQGKGRTVTGNCYQVRLRPEAAFFFPEIHPLKITARATGKPSVEVPTSMLHNIKTAPTAEVDYIVYLNRNHRGVAALCPFSAETARQSMIRNLYGLTRTLQMQYGAIDRLLTAPVFELRYNTLTEATELLRALAEESAHAGHIVSAG